MLNTKNQWKVNKMYGDNPYYYNDAKEDKKNPMGGADNMPSTDMNKPVGMKNDSAKEEDGKNKFPH